MLNDSLPHRGRRLRFEDIFSVLTMAVDEVIRALSHEERCKHADKDKEGSNRICLIVLHLICLLCRIENRLNADQELELKRLVYKLVRLDPRGTAEAPLLHLACNAESSTLGRYPVCRFPALNVVETLIRVGADVNALDQAGNTALHVALSNKVQRRSIVISLLEHGCHPDMRNKQGKTALDLIKQSSMEVPSLNYVNLQCLAARAIRQHNIPYRGKVPVGLIPFIEMH